MPGPVPKATRARRNKPATAANLPSEATARQAATKRGSVPALPNRGRGKAWHPRTKAWWAEIWESPLATRYLRVHRDLLFNLIELVDARNQLSPLDPMRLKLEAEIRMQRRDLGLTPVDQLRLGWTVAADVAPVVEGKPAGRVLPERDGESEDPRNVLRIVAG